MKCNHQFILIQQRTRQPQITQNDNISRTATAPIGAMIWRDEYGAQCGCPKCGEIRTIWQNGEIQIELNG